MSINKKLLLLLGLLSGISQIYPSVTDGLVPSGGAILDTVPNIQTTLTPENNIYTDTRTGCESAILTCPTDTEDTTPSNGIYNFAHFVNFAHFEPCSHTVNMIPDNTDVFIAALAAKAQSVETIHRDVIDLDGTHAEIMPSKTLSRIYRPRCIRRLCTRQCLRRLFIFNLLQMIRIGLFPKTTDLETIPARSQARVNLSDISEARMMMLLSFVALFIEQAFLQLVRP